MTKFFSVQSVFFSVLFLFLFVSTAHAQVAPRLDQLIKDTRGQSGLATVNGGFESNWHFNTDTQTISCQDISGQINNVTFSLGTNSAGSRNVRVAFVSPTNAFTAYESNDVAVSGSRQDYTFNFATPVDVSAMCPNPNGSIYLAIHALSGGTTFVSKWGSASSDSYKNSLFDSSDPVMRDFYFIINGIALVNHTPVLHTIADQVTSEGKFTSFNAPTATDIDGGEYTVTTSVLPDGASFDGTTFRWTPRFDQAGVYPVTFTITDEGNQGMFPPEQVSQTVNVTVQDAAPVLHRLEQSTKDTRGFFQVPAANGAFISNWHFNTDTQTIACQDISGQIESLTLSLAANFAGPRTVRVAFFSPISFVPTYESNDVTVSGSQNDYTFDFPTPVDISALCSNPSSSFILGVHSLPVAGGIPGVFKYGSASSNAYRDTTFDSSDSAMKDWYFVINPQVSNDAVAPVTSPTQSPSANAAGWNNADVTVNWNWTDEAGGSGIDANNCTQTSATVGEGSIFLTATCKDVAGNIGSSTYLVNIDKTVPTVSAAATTQPNANNWYNTDITTHFMCIDTGSGIPSGTCPQDRVLSAEGSAVSSTAQTVTDLADNISALSNIVTVGIDKTPPTLTNTVTSAPNAAGWNNSEVTVHFACSDALSGVSAISPDTVFSGEGSNLGAQSTCTDNAGNATTNTVSNIKIDTTAPITTVTAPNGWSNTGVTLTLNANDALSGVSVTNYTVDSGAIQTGNSIAISTEGIHALAYWSTDIAGNVETHHTAQVKIDKSAPTIIHTQSPTANTNGWNSGSVTVTFICASSLSGIATCTSPQTKTTQGQNQIVTGTAVNNAGTSATELATVSIDTTVPTIVASKDRAANVHGWYNNNVLVSYTCDDALSGIATCTAARTLTEGANQTVSGSATDAAGNTSIASVTAINIDKTAPTVTITSPTSASYLNTTQLPITWTATDALSGVASQSATFDSVAITNGQSITLLNQTIGTHTVTVTATDNASNVKATSVTFAITVTATSLSNTIDSLLASGGITSSGIANSLKAKLPSQLNAFINELNAQRGKKITESAYQTLLAAAQYLQAHP